MGDMSMISEEPESFDILQATADVFDSVNFEEKEQEFVTKPKEES